MSVWDVYFCSIVGITMHPGYNKPETHKPSIEECAAIADQMLKEREK